MNRPITFMMTVSPTDGRRIMKYAKRHKLTPLQVMTRILKERKPADVNLYYPHPGEILRDEFLPQARLTGSSLAKKMGLPIQHLRAILKEKAPVTKGMAQQLAKFFHNSPRYWMKLQMYHDSQAALLSSSAS